MQSRTSTLDYVAGVYQRVLEVDGVEPDDDFFVLGGTSLSAIKLLDLIRTEHGVTVPAESFYRATAVGELADVVDSLRNEAAR